MLKLVLILTVALWQSSEWNISKKGYALDGYDAVSYFDGAPQKGSTDLSIEYRGAKFLFSSAANLAKFKNNTQKYLPQFGGWCAYAMAEDGEKVKVDPETYTITDGKLYLFYNAWGTNTLEPWKENEDELIKVSTINWQTKYEH